MKQIKFLKLTKAEYDEYKSLLRPVEMFMREEALGVIDPHLICGPLIVTPTDVDSKSVDAVNMEKLEVNNVTGMVGNSESPWTGRSFFDAFISKLKQRATETQAT